MSDTGIPKKYSRNQITDFINTLPINQEWSDFNYGKITISQETWMSG